MKTTEKNLDMLEVLHQIESELPRLLEIDMNKYWHSLLVNYHPPMVERLWYDWNEFRICLHVIHACTTDEALFHTHPWPSAMRIVHGSYEMGIGYGTGETEPPIAAKVMLGPGCEYEMVEPDGWHYVRPLTETTATLMVTGKPWGRSSPKSDKPLGPLSGARVEEIKNIFRKYYRTKN
ncbi:MAG: hypothetical protein KBB86_03345 [Candidatus Pacebacteria bacterium]|nr:hypothetical protein [Candidatus Paceibacterota bacterium]